MSGPASAPPSPPRGDDYRCGGCGGAIGDHLLRARRGYPLGECTCPHCDARVAKIDHGASWRGWMRVTFLALGVVGAGIALREWPDGTWWPYALVAVTGVLMALWLRRRDERRLVPVARD